MKVQFIGGVPPDDEQLRGKCIEMCRAIGCAVASAGHSLIIGTADEVSIDPFIAQGANRSRKSGTPVQVVIPVEPSLRNEGDGRFFVPFLGSRDYPRLQVQSRQARGPWGAAHLTGSQIADILVVIGGGPMTEAAAYDAIAIGKPVLAIPAFGGRAKQVFEAIADDWREVGMDEMTRYGLENPNPDRVGQTVLSAIDLLMRNNPYRPDRSNASALAVGTALIVTLTLWVALFLEAYTLPQTLSIILAALVSALFGGLLKIGTRLLQDADTGRSIKNTPIRLVLGVGVAFVFMLLYLAGGMMLTWEPGKVLEPGELRQIIITLSLISIGAAYLLDEALPAMEAKLRQSLKEEKKR
jgi:hypothetical protein